ncbi:FapA family protein [Lederbergia citrisecunda]|uniref:flagellar assembly protein A n=1 Tax=Lederbergia citrisecunda TaxID=2833583 RepID=UPI003D29635D
MGTSVNDKIIPAQFSIRLIEQNIIAILTVMPGKRIRRQLDDTEAEEQIVPYNHLVYEDIMQELERMGITERINHIVILEATQTLSTYEAIVAKGHLPVEGFDGDLYLPRRSEERFYAESGKVDFREMNPIETVGENELVATYLPAVPGVAGMDLFGRPVPTKEVCDLNLRLGRQLEIRGNDIYACAPGRLLFEKHGTFVKIEVTNEFSFDGDVDLSSGNIRFNGDVRIGKDVENSMFVGATGKVYIGGAVRKATVEAGASTMIEGNVFSSTVTVGMHEVLEEVLAEQLDGLLSYLERIKDTILQIIQIRGVQPEEVDASELKDLVRVILKERYLDFQQDKHEFIQKATNHSAQLSPEWKPVIDKLYNIFTDTSLTVVRNAGDFSDFLKEAHALVEHYSASGCGGSMLQLPYAINSALSCNGTIEVTDSGLYNCTVNAKKQVSIEGCCRGGVVFAGEKVSIKETGSTKGVKTVVKTDSDGTITIGLARCGTEIWIGDKVYHIDVDKLGVHARVIDGHFRID